MASKSAPRCCVVVGRTLGYVFENHRLPFRRVARCSDGSSSSRNDGSIGTAHKDASAATDWEGLLSVSEFRQLTHSFNALPASAAEGPLLLEGWGGLEKLAVAALI
ncbi:hypothetical protein cyc_00909 [Cyclospora cayetanensis]|nr:hypothetical protein cyc_00909 [Cyclospora cayetanensis]